MQRVKNREAREWYMHHALGSARFDSRGEPRLAERLKDFLEENACSHIA